MKIAPPLLSLVILNWNTADLLARCLASLENVSVPHETIVVDNGSTDGSSAMVAAQFPTVRLLALEGNVGFARGNNAGLALAHGEYLMLLNPDTEVRPRALEALVTFMEAHRRAGIVGPTLWNPDGSLQPSLLPRPTLWGEFLLQTMLYRLVPGHTRTRRATQPQQVEGVTGAALLIRRPCLEEIGPLDPNIFMFYEDTDWCQRAHAAGWEVWFVPCAGVMHIKAAASSRLARTRTLVESHRSAAYYFRKHYGSRAVMALRLVTLIGGLLRWARSAAGSCAGSRRADHRARRRAYAYLLRWAMTGRGLEEIGD